MPSEGSKVKHIQLSFPASSYMYCDVSGFPESFHNVMYGTWWKTSILSNFALWNVIFFICFSGEIWHKAMSHDPALLAKTEMLLLCPNMIPWPVTNSPICCELLQKSLIWITISLLFSTFLWCVVAVKKKNVFIFAKYIYVGQWKLRKSYLCHFVN